MDDKIYYDNKVYTSDENENDESDKKGFAITALVLGIVSLLCFCCGLGFITAPISIIFGIISLAKHRGGKIMSIIGIVLSAITILIFGIIVSVYGDFAKDYIRFIENYNEVVTEYRETGELPDYIEKYNDPKYEKYWEDEYDSFYDFFDAIIDQIDSNMNNSGTEEEKVDLGAITYHRNIFIEPAT
jgi:cell division protein FtsW (lipid II flippase)